MYSTELVEKKRYRARVVLLSFVAAMILMAIPLPEWAVPWRPMWVVLVLIYWCMALPGQTSVLGIFFMGLVMDVYQGSVFGLNALSLLVIAHVTHRMYAMMRMFPWQQQALYVFFILVLYLFIGWLVRALLGFPPIGSLDYWMPAISSVLLWPWIFVLLRGLRRDFY